VTLLGQVAEQRRVTVAGVSPEVVRRVASAHPTIASVVLPAVRTKRDLRPIVAHVRAVRRLAPTLVHVNLRTPYAAQYGLLAALAATGAPVVAVEHLPLRSQSRVSRWFKRQTSRRLAAHVAVGDRVARFVEDDAGLPGGSIRVIRNGVPADDGTDVERLAPGPVVGAIGRLDPQKGFDVLVRALGRLRAISAVIVGDGEEAAELRALAERTGVSDRLVLAGPRVSARAALRGFDVLAAPSRFEGLPLVVLEAMAARVPVVAAAVGDVGEAVTDGETGILVRAEDADGLAAAIETLVQDEALRTRLADRAHAVWAERFDAKRMVEEYERLYAEVER
jgi:glycosyltransferase involved in cell wall biosynthesis